jgi:hypothetical protein
MIPQKIDKRYIPLGKHPARSCKISWSYFTQPSSKKKLYKG